MHSRRWVLSALLMPFVAVTAQPINERRFDVTPQADFAAPPNAGRDQLTDLVIEARLQASAEEKGRLYMPKHTVPCERPSPISEINVCR